MSLSIKHAESHVAHIGSEGKAVVWPQVYQDDRGFVRIDWLSGRVLTLQEEELQYLLNEIQKVKRADKTR